MLLRNWNAWGGSRPSRHAPLDDNRPEDNTPPEAVPSTRTTAIGRRLDGSFGLLLYSHLVCTFQTLKSAHGDLVRSFLRLDYPAATGIMVVRRHLILRTG